MDYEKLKEVIAKQIKENGRREITGPVLQAVLMAMVDCLGEVYPQTYTDEEKAQARANIDALSDYDGEITKEKLSLEVQAILNDVANKQNITDASLATIAKTIVGAINEVYKGGLKDASITTSKIEDGAVTEDKLASSSVTNEKIADNAVTTEKVNDGAITEPKLDTDLVNVINSAVQPPELASAIATALTSYVAKADIVDTTGSATDKVISQHGVTEAINGVNDKVTDLAEKVNGKQDALTLTVKDNGNIVIANIQGQSKEFMPATPSGDPMHYAYVTAGAEYNDTGADIVKTAPWADMLDDDYDGPYGKTVVHKAGYWYLNGLGDITNDEIRKIYQLTSDFPRNVNNEEVFAYLNIRTNFSNKRIGGYSSVNFYAACHDSKLVVIDCKLYSISSAGGAFVNCSNLAHIGLLSSAAAINYNNTFSGDNNLTTVKLARIASNIQIPSPKLSIKSVLYMINNEAATSPITITLHAAVYNRCMANADILAALKQHTKISLASA